MKFLIVTDLEGVSGTQTFAETRTTDNALKGPSMKQLARETNACIAGVREIHPDAVIDVLDGHGTGGLFPEDVIGGNYIRHRRGLFAEIMKEYVALLFVGQHAMAGTVNATLNHTYNSLTVMYYRLNGIFLGEFGGIATLAGTESVPIIFLAGDDKAVLEAQMFVPDIVTVVTKHGRGTESAEHINPDIVCEHIQIGAAIATRKMGEIKPFTSIQPPYEFEARHFDPIGDELGNKPGVIVVDERTYRIKTDNIWDLPF